MKQTPCKQCGKPFEQPDEGFRRFCFDCRKLRKAEQGRRGKTEKLKLAEGEFHGNRNDGLFGIAKCSQRDATQKLAVWEAFEQIANGATDVEIRPISQQALQQIERSAILKIRNALKPFWKEQNET